MKVLTHAKTKEQTSSKHYCFWNLTLGPLQGPPVLPWNTLRVSELSLIHVLWNLGLARLGLHPGLKGVTVFLSGLFWALPHQFSPAEERLDPLMPTHPLAPSSSFCPFSSAARHLQGEAYLSCFRFHTSQLFLKSLNYHYPHPNPVGSKSPMTPGH